METLVACIGWVLEVGAFAAAAVLLIVMAL